MVPGIGNSVLAWKKIRSRGGKENTVFPLPDPDCDVWIRAGGDWRDGERPCNSGVHQGDAERDGGKRLYFGEEVQEEEVTPKELRNSECFHNGRPILSPKRGKISSYGKGFFKPLYDIFHNTSSPLLLRNFIFSDEKLDVLQLLDLLLLINVWIFNSLCNARKRLNQFIYSLSRKPLKPCIDRTVYLTSIDYSNISTDLKKAMVPGNGN